MRVVLLARDLIFGSRIASAAAARGHDIKRLDDPSALPDPAAVDLLVINWGDSAPGWAASLIAWKRSADSTPRLVVYGPHADVASHRELRAAGLGPMRANSRLAGDLSTLLGPEL